MSIRNSLLAAVSLAMLGTGCTSTGATPFTLVGNTTMTWNVALGAAAAVYLVYDPLSPNWEIEESRVSEDTYRLSMKMKRFHTGGSGESFQIMKRRAASLQQELGYAGYQILTYTEGIDSETIRARRVAEGAIRFLKQDDADSFALNAY